MHLYETRYNNLLNGAAPVNFSCCEANMMEHFISLGADDHRFELNPDHITAFRIDGSEVTLYLLNGQCLALTSEESKKFIELFNKGREKKKIGLSPY